MSKGLRLERRRNTAVRVNRLIDEADRLYAVEGRPSHALRVLEHALSLDPRNVDGLVIKGRILSWLDRVSEAIGCLDLAVSIDPVCGEAFLERARILYAVRRQPRKALADVRAAISHAARDRWVKVEALRLQGHVLEALGRTDAALDSYRAALRLDPKDVDSRESLGNALLALRSPGQALREFEKVLQVLNTRRKPNELDVGFALASKAEALNMLGRHFEALRATESGLRRVKEDVPREALKAVHEETVKLMRSAARQGDRGRPPLRVK